MGGSKLVSLAVTFVLASSAAWARPTRRAMAVHEQISGVPVGFATAKASADFSEDTITLRIALAQNDMTGLEEALYSVSTPGSSAYGQYLSKAEVGPIRLMMRSTCANQKFLQYRSKRSRSLRRERWKPSRRGLQKTMSPTQHTRPLVPSTIG